MVIAVRGNKNKTMYIIFRIMVCNLGAKEFSFGC